MASAGASSRVDCAAAPLASLAAARTVACAAADCWMRLRDPPSAMLLPRGRAVAASTRDCTHYYCRLLLPASAAVDAPTSWMSTVDADHPSSLQFMCPRCACLAHLVAVEPRIVLS